MENKQTNYKAVFEFKAVVLFIVLSGFFIANAIFAEFLGVKIFSVERSLGFQPLNFSLFGKNGLSFNMAAGVLNWPIVFIMTDIINEYYGRKGVRFLSFLTATLIAFGFLMFYIGINLSPADFWSNSHYVNLPSDQAAVVKSKVADYNYAFALIFGQGMWIIVGSLAAFLLSQLVDVMAFHQIKKSTGEGKLWLRSTGSTLISQFVDSFVVLFIAFYLSGKFDFITIIVLASVAYTYKLFVAILMTPVIYWVHSFIENYLGKDLAAEMKANAAS